MGIWMNSLSWRKVLLISRKICCWNIWKAYCYCQLPYVLPRKKMHISGVLLEKEKKQLTLGQSHPGMCVENWWISVQKALWLMEAEMMCAVLWNYTVSSSALRLTSASHGLWETSSEAPMAIQRISWCFQTSWNLNHPKPRMVSKIDPDFGTIELAIPHCSFQVSLHFWEQLQSWFPLIPPRAGLGDRKKIPRGMIEGICSG